MPHSVARETRTLNIFHTEFHYAKTETKHRTKTNAMDQNNPWTLYSYE